MTSWENMRHNLLSKKTYIIMQKNNIHVIIIRLIIKKRDLKYDDYTKLKNYIHY